MSTEAIKNLARQSIEALNQENWEDLVGEYAVNEEEARSFITMHRPFRAAFPDYHCTIEEMIAEGDKVVMRQTVRATHTREFPMGELKGIAPTHKKLEWTEVTMYRFADGKIVDAWFVVDGVSRLQQLGVLPAS